MPLVVVGGSGGGVVGGAVDKKAGAAAKRSARKGVRPGVEPGALGVSGTGVDETVDGVTDPPSNFWRKAAPCPPGLGNGKAVIAAALPLEG